MATLTFESSAGEIEVALRPSGVILGRLPTCDVVLTDPSVSRRHAEVYKDATGWRIRDLGSSSGVRVDGVRHEECPLRDGMVIALGKQLLNVQIPPPTESGTGVLASRTLADFMLVQGLQGGEDDPKISDLGRVVRLAAAIRDAPTVARIAATVLQEAALATSAERAMLCLIDEEGHDISRFYLHDRPFEASSTFVGRVLAERAAVIAADVDDDQELAAANSVMFDEVRAILAVPLWSGTDVIGVLYLDRRSGNFMSANLELVLALGYLGAAEIERVEIRGELDLERRRRRTVARLLPSDLAQALGMSGEVELHEGVVAVAVASLVSLAADDVAQRLALAEAMAPIVIEEGDGVLVDASPDHLIVLHRSDDDLTAAVLGAARSAELLISVGEALCSTRQRWSAIRVQAVVHAGMGLVGAFGTGLERGISLAGPVRDEALETLRRGRPGRIRITESIGPDLAPHRELVPEREGTGVAIWMIRQQKPRLIANTVMEE